MTKIRVTKEFSFEMAHALWNYDGPCKNIHGHSYKLFTTVIGNPITEKSNNKYGMVIDFGDLKRIIRAKIINRFDHSMVVCKDAPHHLLGNIEQMFEKYEVTPYQPTCENLVADFASILIPELPAGVELFSLKLYETESSFAEWFTSDNL